MKSGKAILLSLVLLGSSVLATIGVSAIDPEDGVVVPMSGHADPLDEAWQLVEKQTEIAYGEIGELVAVVDAFEEFANAQKGRVFFGNLTRDTNGDGKPDAITDRDGDSIPDVWHFSYDQKQRCMDDTRPKNPPLSLPIFPPGDTSKIVPFITDWQSYLQGLRDGSSFNRLPCKDSPTAIYDNRTVWVQSDFVFGPLSDGVGMHIGPSDGRVTYAGLKVTQAAVGAHQVVDVRLFGNQRDSDKLGGPETVAFGTLMIPTDADEDPVAHVGFPGQKVGYTNHPSSTDGTGAYFAADYDFGFLNVTDPLDLDGDGVDARREAGEWPPANPVNAKSIPGDADADGCRWDIGDSQGIRETQDEDRTPAKNPCKFLFPYLLVDGSLSIEDKDPLTPGIQVYGIVNLTARFKINPALPNPDAAALVNAVTFVAWQDNLANKPTRSLCSIPRSGFALGVDIKCQADTRPVSRHIADTMPDMQTAVKEHNYGMRATIDVDSAVLDDQTHTMPGLFVMRNDPKSTMVAFRDVADKPIERPGNVAGQLELEFTGTHPKHAITAFDIEAIPYRQVEGKGSAMSEQKYAVTIPASAATKTPEGNFVVALDSAEFTPWRDLPTPRPSHADFYGYQFTVKVITDAGSSFSHKRWAPSTGDFVVKKGSDNLFYLQAFNNLKPLVTTKASSTIGSGLDKTVRLPFHAQDRDEVPFKEVYALLTNVDDSSDVIKVTSCPRVEDPSNFTDATNRDADWNDDFLCSWKPGATVGDFSWKIVVVDADGGDNTNTTDGLGIISIINDLPVLDKGDHEVNLHRNRAGEVDVTFVVHYKDSADAYVSGNVTLQNPTHGNRTLDLATCAVTDSPTSARGGLSSGTDLDLCVSTRLPELTNWTYVFNVTNAAGQVVQFPAKADPPLEAKLPEACNNCFTGSEFLFIVEDSFQTLGTTVNGLASSTPLPVVPDDLGFPDDDQDFVPNAVEGLILDMHAIEVKDGKLVIHDAWHIGVRNQNHSSPQKFVFNVSIAEDGNTYKMKVCHPGGTCYVDDADLSQFTVATTQQGILIRILDPRGTEALLLQIDASLIGRPGVQFGRLVVGLPAERTYINLTSDPLDVQWKKIGVFPHESSLYDAAYGNQSFPLFVPANDAIPGSGQRVYERTRDGDTVTVCIAGTTACEDVKPPVMPTLSLKRDETDTFSLCFDPHRHRSAESGEMCQRFEVVGDADADGVPDPLEPIICGFVQVPRNPFYNDGKCNAAKDDWTPPGDPFGPDEG